MRSSTRDKWQLQWRPQCVSYQPLSTQPRGLKMVTYQWPEQPSSQTSSFHKKRNPNRQSSTKPQHKKQGFSYFVEAFLYNLFSYAWKTTRDDFWWETECDDFQEANWCEENTGAMCPKKSKLLNSKRKLCCHFTGHANSFSLWMSRKHQNFECVVSKWADYKWKGPSVFPLVKVTAVKLCCVWKRYQGWNSNGLRLNKTFACFAFPDSLVRYPTPCPVACSAQQQWSTWPLWPNLWFWPFNKVFQFFFDVCCLCCRSRIYISGGGRRIKNQNLGNLIGHNIFKKAKLPKCMKASEVKSIKNVHTNEQRISAWWIRNKRHFPTADPGVSFSSKSRIVLMVLKNMST